MTSFDQLSVELKTSTNVKICIFKEKEFQRINIRKSLTLTMPRVQFSVKDLRGCPFCAFNTVFNFITPTPILVAVNGLPMIHQPTARPFTVFQL